MKSRTGLTTSFLLSITLLASILIDSFGEARAADGRTPAQESICNELLYASPGLYGLCIAFCEAQDCDQEDLEAGRCNQPSEQILLSYNRIKNAGDPEMPCLGTRPECPCFDAQDLATLDVMSCSDTILPPHESVYVVGSDAPVCEHPILGAREDVAGVYNGEDSNSCFITNWSAANDGSCLLDYIANSFLTEQEAAICLDLLLAETYQRGIDQCWH